MEIGFFYVFYEMVGGLVVQIHGFVFDVDELEVIISDGIMMNMSAVGYLGN